MNVPPLTRLVWKVSEGHYLAICPRFLTSYATGGTPEEAVAALKKNVALNIGLDRERQTARLHEQGGVSLDIGQITITEEDLKVP